AGTGMRCLANFWTIGALVAAMPACSREQHSATTSEAVPSTTVTAAATTGAELADLAPPGKVAGGDGVSTPPVTLDGAAHAYAVTLVDSAPKRVYARALRAWIHDAPTRGSARLGYLRVGGSAPIAGPIESGSGCEQGWQPIKPRGYVCMNDQATYDVTDGAVDFSREHPPDFSRKLPYIYGTVRKPGPIYGALPERAELATTEPGYEQRIPEWLDAGGEIGSSYAPEVWLNPGQPAIDARAAWQQGLTEGVPDILRD